MSVQVALINAGLAFIAAAVAGGGDFVNIRLPKLPTRARLISAVVGVRRVSRFMGCACA